MELRYSTRNLANRLEVLAEPQPSAGDSNLLKYQILPQKHRLTSVVALFLNLTSGVVKSIR